VDLDDKLDDSDDGDPDTYLTSSSSTDFLNLSHTNSPFREENNRRGSPSLSTLDLSFAAQSPQDFQHQKVAQYEWWTKNYVALAAKINP